MESVTEKPLVGDSVGEGVGVVVGDGVGQGSGVGVGDVLAVVSGRELDLVLVMELV